MKRAALIQLSLDLNFWTWPQIGSASDGRSIRMSPSGHTYWLDRKTAHVQLFLKPAIQRDDRPPMVM